MKRSEVQGQVEEGEVKRSKTQAAEESGPEFNPFLVEPVIVKLLKLVEKVSQLKELRKMCQTWDEFNLKEIEDRAFNGKIKAIDFRWTNKFQSKSEAEANFIQFMGDTSAIPRLFSSFQFNFPESWAIFQNHMDFFSNYPVTFVDLFVADYLVMSWVGEQIPTPNHKLLIELLIKFMETDIWGNFKEIYVFAIRQQKEMYGSNSSLFFGPSSGNMERKLQKLTMRLDTSQILEAFKSAFASGKYTNLSSMELGRLSDLDFPGFDPSRLTRLEIVKVMSERSSPTLKFTSGLINLARNGMRLKNFGMRIDLTPNYWSLNLRMDEFLFDNLPLICSNLTKFLASQSSTLERLCFKFVCYLKDSVDVPGGADIWCKIHLPIFEVLHTLKLNVDFQLIEANPRRTHSQLLGMTQSLSGHFPKLVNMTLEGDISLIALKVNSTPDKSGQLQLERLKILDKSFFILYDSNIWNTSFVGVIGSVKELTCYSKLLFGERLPWAESLRSLSIYDINLGIDEQEIFKINHLQKLERINTRYFDIKDREINAGNHYNRRFAYSKVEDYLNTFKEATELPLTSITFAGPSMEEEMKEEFIQYFPFPVQFK